VLTQGALTNDVPLRDGAGTGGTVARGFTGMITTDAPVALDPAAAYYTTCARRAQRRPDRNHLHAAGQHPIRSGALRAANIDPAKAYVVGRAFWASSVVRFGRGRAGHYPGRATRRNDQYSATWRSDESDHLNRHRLAASRLMPIMMHEVMPMRIIGLGSLAVRQLLLPGSLLERTGRDRSRSGPNRNAAIAMR
jgi:hypothetical protein